MKVLFLITARGGSKSVPRKNLRKIQGISLIGFKAIAALRSSHCARLIISTDSDEIAGDARKYGVEVPFMRPAELATDSAGSADVIAHAMDWIERENMERYDAVMLLEPSSPFTRAVDFDAAIDLMRTRNASVVLGMRKMEVNSAFVGPIDREGRIPEIINKMKGMRSVIRQDVRPEYTMNGALYLFKWQFFRAHRSLYHEPETTYGYVMPDEYSLEIDNMTQLHWAEFLVERGYVDMALWRGQEGH